MRLTQLPNRRQLFEHLRAVLGARGWAWRPRGAVFIDVDHFKTSPMAAGMFSVTACWWNCPAPGRHGGPRGTAGASAV